MVDAMTGIDATICPCCGRQVTRQHFRCEIARAAGKIGGKATGKRKARTPEQARAAAMVGVRKRLRVG